MECRVVMLNTRGDFFFSYTPSRSARPFLPELAPHSATRSGTGGVFPMSRSARIALIVVLVILLLPVVAVGGLVLVAKTQWGERWLEARVSSTLERPVQIDGISFRWGWPPGLVFAHLRIGNPKWATTPALVDAQ